MGTLTLPLYDLNGFTDTLYISGNGVMWGISTPPDSGVDLLNML